MLALAGEALENPHGKHDETANLVCAAGNQSLQFLETLGSLHKLLVKSCYMYLESRDMRTLVFSVNRGLGVREAQLTGFRDGTDGEVAGVEKSQFEIHHLLAQLSDESVARIGIGGSRLGTRGGDAIV